MSPLKPVLLTTLQSLAKLLPLLDFWSSLETPSPTQYVNKTHCCLDLQDVSEAIQQIQAPNNHNVAISNCGTEA